ncbi:hypothetical protein [Caenispirillum bisanense]|uniref:Uncharacterized protein n=1 Tax=Caenispirillum bisanense TaxID=414052 RepID=A0A286G7R7_9PROT|nr:hypothetical protein [Caenispirillum bisanense]SOD91597.1 hypothetical protein SAMN05421508_1022 [Caenispirillum bisanense]
MSSTATIINLQAARAARGLPVAPPAETPATYQVGQPVTVLGRPIRYGWVVGISRCPLTGTLSYTIQTPHGRIVCREMALSGSAAEREV